MSDLTPAQFRVLQVLATGPTIGEGARLLGLSRNTLTTHLGNIATALDTHSLIEAYFELGWLTVPEAEELQ